ncbi:MAG: hypothetical protein HYV09_40610 [Deltaproteobacteria bacterium]|nr:hypothetical protein [Deltaproteobacteria bacterium]
MTTKERVEADARARAAQAASDPGFEARVERYQARFGVPRGVAIDAVLRNRDNRRSWS